jgi:hypothetical protein
MREELQADTTRRVLSASFPLMAPCAEVLQGAPVDLSRVHTLGIAQERCALRFPVHALRYDRPAHLGLQLLGDDTLRDLVDLAR